MINIPIEISLQRVKKRSYEQFGDRMLLGGDLYKKEFILTYGSRELGSIKIG